MNSFSHIYVAAHQDEMRKSAANERLARQGHVAKGPSRFGAALKGVWSLLNGTAERPVTLPNLTNYPYRG